MDQQFFVSRLLETENLTDNLEDADANTLLNWAVAQIGGLIANPLSAGEKINGLMAVLRKINHLIPDLAVKSSQELVAALADLAQAAQAVFDRVPPSAAADLQNLAESLRIADTPGAIQHLLDWLTGEQ